MDLASGDLKHRVFWNSIFTHFNRFLPHFFPFYPILIDFYPFFPFYPYFFRFLLFHIFTGFLLNYPESQFCQLPVSIFQENGLGRVWLLDLLISAFFLIIWHFPVFRVFNCRQLWVTVLLFFCRFRFFRKTSWWFDLNLLISFFLIILIIFLFFDDFTCRRLWVTFLLFFA